MTSHLDALRLRLSNERIRYSMDKSPIREVWIKQMEREIAAEVQFLWAEDQMSDDELLKELTEL